MSIRIIHEKPRGCGQRKGGKVYLVAEPSEDGQLALWTNIDPPIPYDGEEHRGYILLDLEALLPGEPLENYLVGSSADRLRREVLHEPEIELFGMPLRTRETTGIVSRGGLEALKGLALLDVRRFGLATRTLSRLVVGKTSGEVLATIRHAQERDLSRCLAALWRLWRGSTKQQKKGIRPFVVMAMDSIGAGEDALAL